VNTAATLPAQAANRPVLAGVAAVVLTHRRPRLATRTVRLLLEDEGFAPHQVVLVVDRDGGLDDPELEAQLRVIRLEDNLGPAAGFRAGLLDACADPEVRWVYLVEDDACLLGGPAPRVPGLLSEVDGATGAVVVSGRCFGRRGDRTRVLEPDRHGPRLQAVDVAAWGMTLLHRGVVDAGVLPDDSWFFGYEDFDFFLRLRAAGFQVRVDRDSAYVVADSEQRAAAERPAFGQEPWRAYYVARNTFELVRRHGRPSWHAWHLVHSVRRAQLGDLATKRAIGRGWWDGLRRRSGRHDGFVRTVGERPSA
jgi:GT2 family glycosyltransferase